MPFFAKEQIILKSKEQKLIKIEVSFVDEISGSAKVKILDKNAQNSMMLKLKFTWNLAILDFMYSGFERVEFDLRGKLGILDLRSMGYCKTKQRIINKLIFS